jgi:hypothetical protein
LKEVRPTFFFSVPRVWEKIEEKMKLMAQNNGYVKRSIANWAKGMGRQGTFAETHNTRPPVCFGLAKSLVYNKVKQALGLDEVRLRNEHNNKIVQVHDVRSSSTFTGHERLLPIAEFILAERLRNE